MSFVALETSTRRSSVAVRAERGEREILLDAGRAHSSDLMPSLDKLMRELGADPREIRAVFVGTGPGSYTGLRVGIATAMGLVRATGAAIVGVPSGETLCFGELAEGDEAITLLDARQGQVYFARFRRLADEVAVSHPPCVLAAPDAAAMLPPTITVFGDETVAAACGFDARMRERLRIDVVPRAGVLLELGARRLVRAGAQELREVVPLYLRAFGQSR